MGDNCLDQAAACGPGPSSSASPSPASPLVNCGCQCAPLTFRDAKGEVQGNCLTVDSTGAQWGYVDTSYSSCADLVPSLRFPNNPWSYEACATPAPGSPLCPLAPTSAGHSHYAPQPPVITVIEDNYNYSPELIGQPRETEDAEAAEAAEAVQTNFVAHKVNFDLE